MMSTKWFRFAAFGVPALTVLALSLIVVTTADAAPAIVIKNDGLCGLPGSDEAGNITFGGIGLRLLLENDNKVMLICKGTDITNLSGRGQSFSEFGCGIITPGGDFVVNDGLQGDRLRQRGGDLDLHLREVGPGRSSQASGCLRPASVSGRRPRRWSRTPTCADPADRRTRHGVNSFRHRIRVPECSPGPGGLQASRPSASPPSGRESRLVSHEGPMNASRQGRAGFSLIELLVVIMIIGTLVALLLPAVQAAREAARRIQCGSHLRQVGLSLQNYHDVHHTLPAGSIVAADFPRFTTGWGWGAKILPYLEQAPLFDVLNLTVPVAEGENHTALRQSLTVFSCPSDPVPAAIQVGAIRGDHGQLRRFCRLPRTRHPRRPLRDVGRKIRQDNRWPQPNLPGRRAFEPAQPRRCQLHLGVVRPPRQAIRRPAELDPSPRSHRFRADQHGV